MALEVLASLEWSLSSKCRHVSSVDERACDYVLLGWEAPRTLWFRSWVGAPIPYGVWSNLRHVCYLVEVMDKLARRRIRSLCFPSRPAPGFAGSSHSFLCAASIPHRPFKCETEQWSRLLANAKVQEALVHPAIQGGVAT